MVRTTLALWVPLLAAAANPPVISGVVADNITHSQFRVSWVTDSPSTTVINYGPTSTYGCTATNTLGTSVTTHAYYVSGSNTSSTCLLSPSETVHFAVCSTDSSQACSADFTATLLPLPSPHPAVPIPPTAAASDVNAEPAINGTTLTVSANCSDLQSDINTLAAMNSANNHLIQIPSGTVCLGHYLLPPQAGSGWIVIRTSGVMLPPFGVRPDLTYEASYATIHSNTVYAVFVPAPASGSCSGSEGNFEWQNNSTGFSLWKCDPANSTWTAITPAATGTTVPSTCNTGDFFFNTAFSDHERTSTWWCLRQNSYTPIQWTNWSTFADSAAIYTGANAARYRIEGVHIGHIGIPATDTARCTGTTPGGRQIGCFGGSLVYTLSSNDRIVLDRDIIDGVGYPNRQWYGVQLDGSNMAVTSSYFNEINLWFANTSSGQDVQSSGINMTFGPGPYLIDNNYFKNVIGITVYCPDDGGNAPGVTECDDGTFTRNTVEDSDAFNFQSRFSNGRVYWQRHRFELKRGKRWLIKGNTFIGGFATVNQAASVEMGPRPGAGFNVGTTVGITDIDARFNYFLNTPGAFFVFGHSDGSYPPQANNIPEAVAMQRVRLDNNAAYAVNVTSGVDSPGCSICTKQGVPFGAPSGEFLVSNLQPEDFIITHNTVWGAMGNYSMLAGWDATYNWLGEGLLMTDNIAAGMPIDFPAVGGIWWDGAASGTAGLNKAWSQYLVTNNSLQNSNGDPGGYPAGQSFQTSAAGFGFVSTNQVSFNDMAADLRLKYSSPYISGSSLRATDGLSRGADLNTLDVMRGVVKDVRVLSVTGSSAAIAFFAPDSQGCSVDVGTDPNFGPGHYSRVNNAGGSRNQSVTLSGLAAQTAYYYRVNCQTQQPMGGFVTR